MRRRKCIVIKMRHAITLILIFVLGGIRQSHSESSQTKDTASNNSNNNNNEAISLTIRNLNDTTVMCPNTSEVECSSLKFPCIRCTYNYSCHYGRDVNVTCTALENVKCKGESRFTRQMNCRYCYQTESWQHTCAFIRSSCNTHSQLNDYYKTNCTVHPNVLCLGNRSFTRNVKCNWTQGYRWSTALIISLTLGGFGADRFYLGHWQEAIGKLFSFGGLGVWTIIDVLLISLHYLGPADGSLYI